MDRVKAAIFSSLGDKVVGARVLDLFAGAGGLGIEALSRGAARAVFIESSRNAAKAIERNLTIAGVKGRVYVRDVFRYIETATEVFEIIFADPPYDAAPGGKAFTDLLLKNPRIPQLVAAEGVFVLEKRPRERLPESASWNITRVRRYGATEVIFAELQR
jgi:16S rRNA (guanine966-N2)-methyltransferase